MKKSNLPPKRNRTIREVQAQKNNSSPRSQSNTPIRRRAKTSPPPKSDHRVVVLSIALILTMTSFALYAFTNPRQVVKELKTDVTKTHQVIATAPAPKLEPQSRAIHAPEGYELAWQDDFDRWETKNWSQGLTCDTSDAKLIWDPNSGGEFLLNDQYASYIMEDDTYFEDGNLGFCRKV